MRLTDRTDYALRVLMVLASSERRHTVPELAEAFGVSANHLTKVVQSLQAEGWVRTTSGRRGGAELDTSPESLSVGRVVRAMEPDLDLVECLQEQGRCPLEGPCRLAGALRRARAAFLAELDQVSLADLVDRRATQLLRALSPTLSVHGATR